MQSKIKYKLPISGCLQESSEGQQPYLPHDGNKSSKGDESDSRPDSGNPEGGAPQSQSQSQPPPAAPKKPLHPCLVGAQVQLEMKPLWDEFHELGTEMIVTKAGR